MRLPSSRRLALAATSTALAALAAPALAGCADSAFGCGLDHDSTTAQPVSARAVVALLDVKADETAVQAYDDLLPEGVEVPGARRLAVSVASYDTGACVRPAGAPSVDCPTQPGWTEGTVSLRAVVDGQEGWYAISRATTSAEQLTTARAAGLPAYLATGGVTRTGQGLSAALSVSGQPALTVAWADDRSQRPETAAFDLLQGRTGTFGVTPLYTGEDRHRTVRAVRPLVPVFDPVGGAPDRNLAVPGLTGTSPTSRARATVTLDLDHARLDDASPSPLPPLPLAEGVTLADLVVPTQTVAAAAWQVEGTLLTQTDALDDGQDGPFPAPPAVATAIVAPPGAQTGGYATRVTAMTRGSALTFVNTDTTQHDVTAQALDGDRRPLFHSDTIGPGTAVVKGAETLPSGQYTWICSLHSGMTGELHVL